MTGDAGEGVGIVLDVSLLGAVKASTAGREHALGGPKQRGLLARLVVSRGRSLPAELLIDDLWDDEPPHNPTHALQARISRLRSAVPIEIELMDGGYRIDPSVIQTDAARFEQLCKQGSTALNDGDFAQAAEHFSSALQLWRGQAFTGLLDITALRAEAARLEQLWSAARSDRIDLDLALGRSADVISELHSLVEEDPFTERHWSQLMTALYCDGRTKDALDAFSRARMTFTEHLGVEPSSELGRLHLGILQEQEPVSLLRLPSTAPGAAPEVAHAPGRADAERPAASVQRLTSNHPDTLASALRDRRALLLTGPDGIGKTHLLRALRARYEAQRYAVPLLTASPLSRAVPLGIFIGILPEKWTTPAALVDHFTRNRASTLLLVDNVDQLDDASLFVISQLLRNSRMPTILTTTDLAEAPDDIRALYDSGDITEIAVNPLTPADADDLVLHTLGGTLTPESRPRIFAAAQGNPLHLREILTASVEEDRLVDTPHGWELRDDPASTPRLTQLVGERFANLDRDALEAAAKIAIAGEYPAFALETLERRMLARAGVVEYSAPDWLRLTHPLDGEFLRAQCSDALWHDLCREVLAVLRSDLASGVPAAVRRAQVLALDLGDEPLDIDATLALAEHALAAFDERLALRAASAVIALAPDNVSAQRIAGLAASALGDLDDATAHFESASSATTTDAERTAVALAHAQHLGLRHHDATAALDRIERAVVDVDDANEMRNLQRDAIRWAAVAGTTRGMAAAEPGDASDAAAALGLITAALSGVITGRLDDAVHTLRRLRDVPDEIIALIPGGAAMVELTSIMALSNSGDLDSARRRLHQAIAEAEAHAPESLGAWEYALGFSELLSGDVERAEEIATSAVAHLQWRDTTGLLPAALALTGAAAAVSGRSEEAAARFDSVPAAADGDPKVIMLRAWAEAWGEKTAGHRGDAARRLIESARGLLHAQHSYFAGMLAHCAVRTAAVMGGKLAADAGDGDDADRSQCLADASAVLDEAQAIAGGGLLEFFVRHAVATASDNRSELDTIAADAETLGMTSTAADTRLVLARGDDSVPEQLIAHHREAAERLIAAAPTMALWSAEGLSSPQE
ncbi:AfsR/SARP family transcriptional regulator [Microbacterium esteraromaticum]|uniref:AfsR/SARP family transcriptional regulator n=1 Tax=Microbacterium esteraromaticum TaxID=57043 RepID=UPI00211B065C|nr:AfsR/SARP family transcriptional regulator [Microbacterium esteraromaticum]